MTDIVTREQAEQELRGFWDKAQQVARDMHALSRDADGLGASELAFHRSLGPAAADLDPDTLAAIGALHTATVSVDGEAATLAHYAGEGAGLTDGALDSVAAHSRLSEEVQAHKGAGRMGFYRTR